MSNPVERGVRGFIAGILVAAGFVVPSVLAAPASAATATFTVNSTADAGDANKGDGTCATSGGVCTLRAALDEADALYADDSSTSVTVNFTIPGSGVHVRLLTRSALFRLGRAISRWSRAPLGANVKGVSEFVT